MWELRGCPYCRETHLVNFARPDIEDFIKANFEVLQLNIIGSRKVTDFDGAEISEKALAAKYGIRFTPTFQFFPDSAAGLAEKPPEKREVARAPGYLRPDDFLAMFRFVREKGYETKSFREYVKGARSLTALVIRGPSEARARIHNLRNKGWRGTAQHRALPLCFRARKLRGPGMICYFPRIHRALRAHQQRHRVLDLLDGQHLVGAEARHGGAGEGRVEL